MTTDIIIIEDLELNVSCCANPSPRLDDDPDGESVWAVVCDSCDTDLIFLVGRGRQ